MHRDKCQMNSSRLIVFFHKLHIINILWKSSEDSRGPSIGVFFVNEELFLGMSKTRETLMLGSAILAKNGAPQSRAN